MTYSNEQTGLFDFRLKAASEEALDEWYLKNGYRAIAGVDEAGRGALAGPVSAAAVVLGEHKIEGLDDSKKLTPERRSELYAEIWRNARCVGVALVGPARIDETNILASTMEAMKLAVRMLPSWPDIILIDGNQVPNGLDDAVAVIKGDTKSKSIMAASIIAKVTRDRYMEIVSGEFPFYGFERHKGYAVKDHYTALEEHGVTSIHRISFAPCRDMAVGLPEGRDNSTISLRVTGERT